MLLLFVASKPKRPKRSEPQRQRLYYNAHIANDQYMGLANVNFGFKIFKIGSAAVQCQSKGLNR